MSEMMLHLVDAISLGTLEHKSSRDLHNQCIIMSPALRLCGRGMRYNRNFVLKEFIFQCPEDAVAYQLIVLVGLGFSELSSKTDILMSSSHFSQVAEKEEISQSVNA
ncbi:hypothetical protein RF11_04698 [Thelohanellus kitauei]|uniref:Uncharacterized protein n=1 Tax=Thelohanellus kitauei TaxID=669202 RepID=A0A0C2N132_THEKT|nr:hypothetical protein RF11_04698 [Thelohanellus kitauei]